MKTNVLSMSKKLPLTSKKVAVVTNVKTAIGRAASEFLTLASKF